VCGCEKGALVRLDQRRDGRGDFAVPWYSEILKRVEKRQEERLNVQKAWFSGVLMLDDSSLPTPCSYVLGLWPDST
jgi:hypothetical protein